MPKKAWAEGYAVESTLRVLQEQGVRVAARTYRVWRQGGVSAQTVTDAMVIDDPRHRLDNHHVPWRHHPTEDNRADPSHEDPGHLLGCG